MKAKRYISVIRKFTPFLLFLLLISCNKEYHPDENTFRDSKLYGTWIRLSELNSVEPTVEVFTKDGYFDQTMYFESEVGQGYQALGGIWNVEEANNENNLFYNRIHARSRFKYGVWKSTSEYYIEEDTLFLRDLRYDWDTLVKYKDQLIYEGPDFVGIGSSH